MATQVDVVADRLVDAARARMWESGVAAFTVTQVVADAGTSLKSFYRCFAGKDELLVALFEDDARRGAAALAAMVESEHDPVERLRAAVVGLFRFITVDGRLPYAAALVREHLRLAESRPDELRKVLTPFVDLFSHELRLAQGLGAVRAGDTERDARTLFHLVLSHLHALICHQIEDTAGRRGRRPVGFLRRCIAAPAMTRASSRTPRRGRSVCRSSRSTTI